jgi:hypothetical protein
VEGGKIQLPDFQREWVWDDEHIRSLIASVSLAFPIGAIMLLQTGGDGVQFQPRPVQGAPARSGVQPEYLILDGQQRITALYLSLIAKDPVPTKTSKGQAIERVYYLDIAKCLDPDQDRLDAVLSLPPDRKITSDFGRKVELDAGTMEKEHDLGLFPLARAFEHPLYTEWRQGYEARHRQDDERMKQLWQFEREVIGGLHSYRIPMIELLRDTPKEAVCQVFEKVNTGGVVLTVFELLTAMYAADNFRLRPDWEARQEKMREQTVLTELDETAFLTACTLLASYERHLADERTPVTCKRRDVLKLKLDEYLRVVDRVQAGFLNAARFLAREKVFDTWTLPYTTQLIPLSAICAVLGDRFEQDPVRQKLARWYWSGVFGELYGGANESRYAFDLPEFVSWIEGGGEPRTVRSAAFDPVRLLSLQTRNSAAYKGLMALLMKNGSEDFLSGDPIEITSYFDLAIDIHHLFPKAYCEGTELPKAKWNSVVNKAPLSSKTNRIIGGHAPSSYLASLERNHGLEPERLDRILGSHQINPLLLRNDHFDLFIQDRACRLLDLIEKAMGKKVQGRESEETVSAFGAPLVSILGEETAA